MAETLNLPQTTSENEASCPKTAQEALATEKKVPSANSGNVIFTCMGEQQLIEDGLPREQNYKPRHPLYQTSSNLYGEMHSTPASVPSTFHGKLQRFSQHLGLCGMYRNHSLNTAMDRSKVYDQPRIIYNGDLRSKNHMMTYISPMLSEVCKSKMHGTQFETKLLTTIADLERARLMHSVDCSYLTHFSQGWRKVHHHVIVLNAT